MHDITRALIASTIRARPLTNSARLSTSARVISFSSSYFFAKRLLSRGSLPIPLNNRAFCEIPVFRSETPHRF